MRRYYSAPVVLFCRTDNTQYFSTIYCGFVWSHQYHTVFWSHLLCFCLVAPIPHSILEPFIVVLFGHTNTTQYFSVIYCGFVLSHQYHTVF